MNSYEQNMNAILNLPIVKDLLKKNKKLQKKNKALEKQNKSLHNLIYSLPEFRCSCHRKCKNKKSPVFEQTVEFVDKVCVKIEPDIETNEPDVSIDDEVEIVEKKTVDSVPNIVYEIEETEVVEEEEKEEVVEEEEELEEGEVVEEEEEEEVVEEEEEDEEVVVEEEEEEVVVEEEEEEEEVVVEDEEEEGEVVEAVEDDEEEEGEVYEITISGKSYYTTNENHGKIYAIDKNEEVGDEIGEFKNGKASFYKK